MRSEGGAVGEKEGAHQGRRGAGEGNDDENKNKYNDMYAVKLNVTVKPTALYAT